jgi:hypothetical protein
MDISANPLDLIYFTNRTAYKKINKRNETNHEDDGEYKKELLFYRKRILQKTKDLLRNKDGNAEMNQVFKDYSKYMIKYFKFLDKSEIMQQDYQNLGENKKKCVKKDFELESQNKLMMREKKNKEKGTIESCIDVKIKNKKIYEPYIPQKKIINITKEDLKNKGVKNKSK